VTLIEWPRDFLPASPSAPGRLHRWLFAESFVEEFARGQTSRAARDVIGFPILPHDVRPRGARRRQKNRHRRSAGRWGGGGGSSSALFSRIGRARQRGAARVIDARDVTPSDLRGSIALVFSVNAPVTRRSKLRPLPPTCSSPPSPSPPMRFLCRRSRDRYPRHRIGGLTGADIFIALLSALTLPPFFYPPRL